MGKTRLIKGVRDVPDTVEHHFNTLGYQTSSNSGSKYLHCLLLIDLVHFGATRRLYARSGKFHVIAKEFFTQVNYIIIAVSVHQFNEVELVDIFVIHKRL